MTVRQHGLYCTLESLPQELIDGILGGLNYSGIARGLIRLLIATRGSCPPSGDDV